MGFLRLFDQIRAKGKISGSYVTASTGDLLYVLNSDGDLARLPAGSDGKLLKLVSGLPSWQDGAVGTITAVVAGTGLTGGGTSGSVTLSAISSSTFGAVSAIKTANYTTTSDDFTIRCDPSAGGFTITLDSADIAIGQYLKIKNVTTSTNAITVAPSSGTLDGSGSIVMNLGYECITVQYFDTNLWGVT